MEVCRAEGERVMKKTRTLEYKPTEEESREMLEQDKEHCKHKNIKTTLGAKFCVDCGKGWIKPKTEEPIVIKDNPLGFQGLRGKSIPFECHIHKTVGYDKCSECEPKDTCTCHPECIKCDCDDCKFCSPLPVEGWEVKLEALFLSPVGWSSADIKQFISQTLKAEREKIREKIKSGKGRETGIWHYELNDANEMEASAWGEYLSIKEVLDELKEAGDE